MNNLVLYDAFPGVESAFHSDAMLQATAGHVPVVGIAAASDCFGSFGTFGSVGTAGGTFGSLGTAGTFGCSSCVSSANCVGTSASTATQPQHQNGG